MSELTPKQSIFVAEYVKDFNATRAAKDAGYSEKTAHVQGQALLKKPAIAQVVFDAMSDRIERVQVDADWLLARLVQEATADVADLYDGDGALKPVKEWPPIWRQGLVTGIDIDENNVDGVKMGTIKKIKVSDRVRRLELIGKHVDILAFAEKHVLSGPNDGPIQTEEVTPRERITGQLARLATSISAGEDTEQSE